MDRIYDPPHGIPPPSKGKQRDGSPDPNLSKQLEEVKDYQITNGSLLKLVAFAEVTKTPCAQVNVSIRPTPFPRKHYDQAVSLQHCMNELYLRVAADADFVYNTLKPQIESDRNGLLASLWDVHVKCREAGVVQDVVAGIFRADYMLHAEADREEENLKQVEVNTFTVAGGCHADRVANMHHHLLRKRNVEGMKDRLQMQHLPPNNNIACLVAALTAMHNAYNTQFRGVDAAYNKARFGSEMKQKCVLMVVQQLNFNVVDERPLEYGLWEAGIPCFRCEWQSVLSECSIDAGRRLLYQPLGCKVDFEVSVVYFRAGYDPAEYADEDGRGTRLLLEMSRAIKCPDVLTHLAGFKAVQQALAEPGMVERFLTSDETKHKLSAVSGTFMPMHKLDSSPAGLEARRIALDPAQVENYILKPNLEGGGNNVYGADIPSFLTEVVSENDYHNYILMKLITPPSGIYGSLALAEELYEGEVVSELGILGFAMWRRKWYNGKEQIEILRNEASGWTFKTKPRGAEEMNVVKGMGVFDCPVLVWDSSH